MAKKAELAAEASSGKTRWVTAVLIAIFLIVMPRTECYWQRLGWPVLPVMDLLMLAAVLLALVKLVASIRFAIRNWSRRKWGATLPALVYATIIFFAAADIPGLDCEAYQSPVVTRACYEGTMTTATLRLRANGDFDGQSVSLGLRDFISGAWRWEGDTLRLSLSDEPSARKYVRKGDTLLGVAEEGEQRYPLYFLEGWCRRQN